MKKRMTLTLILILVLVAGICVGGFFLFPGEDGGASHGAMQTFASGSDLVKAFLNGQKAQGVDMEKSLSNGAVPQAVTGSAEAPEHSTTNVQVEGVDEADIVKTDGRYIYAVAGQTVYILAAYPPENARVISKIVFEVDSQPGEIFIGDGLLVIMRSTYAYRGGTHGDSIGYPPGGVTSIDVYDLSKIEEPKLLKRVEYEGTYSTSRKIGDDVHVVLTTYPFYDLYKRTDIDYDDIIPKIRQSEGGGTEGAFSPVCEPTDVECVDPGGFTSFTSVVSMSLKNGAVNKRVIAGYSENVYASTENLYIASGNYVYYGYLPDVPGPGAEETTTIYKFKLDGPSTEFLASAEVPGTILNQFSMDESEGYFRIATTRGHVSREGSSSSNNVYVLDQDLNIAGRLEGLAPGERIYSARFMGDRAYLVTFKKVDPFFVLDLSDPGDPRVLGALKIPGYSDYLHPYDENHVIGIGKNTVEAAPEEGGNFAWYQGLKIAIFDVTDVTNPKEMYKADIGDRGTDSYALYDHKAFLFDRERNLLVLPVLLAELTPEQKASVDTQAYDYGKYTFQGAYVYDISLEGGIQLKGRVTHVDDPAQLSENYYYYDSSEAVTRALYIGDSLYTVSGEKIKINDLGSLVEQASITLE